MPRSKAAEVAATYQTRAHNLDYVPRHIIVRHARRDAVEVREGADMAVEKTDLILTLVDPREVTAGVHQPHQKQPGLAAHPLNLDEHLEEVNLREITRAIR